MAGALVVGGATAYLLPGFAGDRLATEVHLPPVTDARPVAGEAHARAPAAPSSPAGKWQDLPPLPAESPVDAPADEEIRVLSLQAALEREKERADAAQRDLLGLRGQLASIEENEALMAEYRSAAIEEKERANNALLRAAASHEELASLRAGMIEAQKAAENERAKATLAHKQIEAMQGQLAALTSKEAARAEAKSLPQPKQDQVAAISPPADRMNVLPANPARSLPPSNERKGPVRDTQPVKDPDATSRKARQASPPKAKAPARPADDAATASIRSPRQRPEPAAARVTMLEREARPQSTSSADKVSKKVPRPRMLAQDARDLPGPRGLSLPRALLPDSRLW
ncbi:hypothetical protein JKG68_16640 [Microvirga aerilata]|uniref:Uncharacterized protein n=1 Tax=Microvirga aerilata TaxID=670292 RepID=A0A936Z9R5_9HYPH|nr:hypothetical protein [Microvirga aerilata]MBL0405596.1 hypothetical protein [Microvirga aerilata]